MHLFPVPGVCQKAAEEAEQQGFDGVLLADSQNLVGDAFVELGRLTAATSRLGLGTGIVNPVTRHPAVVASAIASVHQESGGRAVLGIGRGDSSLAQLGITTPTTDRLAGFVKAVRGYLHGEEVTVDGTSSRIGWIADPQSHGAALPPVGVEVAATGSRTIALAATLADRVLLTVGAEPERIAWAIGVARQARIDAGLDPDALAVGAFLNVGCHDDPAVARSLVRGSAGIFAHFSSLSASAAEGLAAADQAAVTGVGRTYDEARHGLSDAAHIAAMDDDFLDRFTVVGSAETCAARIRELIALGLDRVIVVPGSRDTDPALLAQTNADFAAKALPAIRGR